MKRKRKRLIPCEYMAEVAIAAEDPLTVILAREQEKAFRRFVQLLPLRQRQVLAMCYLWQLRQAAVAKKLGITKQAVSAYRKEAIKNIREFFGSGIDFSPQSTLIGERIFSRGVGAVLDEAAACAESEGGEGGFLFIDEIYRAPSRHFTTPCMIAFDLQKYLDESFRDKLTRIPRGV